MPMIDAPFAFWVLAAGLLGLCVGSFLNVVIYRLPKMMEAGWQAECRDYLAGQSADNAADIQGIGTNNCTNNYTQAPAANIEKMTLATPRSRCPQCGHLITALENIPVLSYLFLRGRCAHCRAHISWRYPLVELMSALLSAYAVWHFGVGLQAIFALPLIWSLLALAFIDADTQLLPDSITLPLLWLGLLVNVSGVFTPLPSAVIGAAAGYLLLWSVYWLFKLATGKEGMGYGDFKLLAALGAWFGWQMLPMILLFASLVGAIFGVGLIIAARLGRATPMPFGPYLALAGALALFFGADILQVWLAG